MEFPHRLINLLIAIAPAFVGAFAQSAVSDDISSLIKSVRSAAGNETKTDKVFDFLTAAYADHGYYQSGNWEKREDFSYITRNIELPPYDPADFHRPADGSVTSGYGYRPSFGRLHKGIDILLNVGDTVRAALPGVVAKVDFDAGGYGHYVVVVHNNGMETRYAHLKKALLLPGSKIDAGEPLGIGGNSGNSTGPHLHFEVRCRGEAIDPAMVFSFDRGRRR